MKTLFEISKQEQASVGKIIDHRPLPMTLCQLHLVYCLLPIAYCITLVTLCLLSLSSCKNNQNAQIAGPDEYYTCSMDVQVMENKPGNCPICHMKLIKVKENQLEPGQIKLSPQQIKLANITYDTIRIKTIAKEIVLTGKVTVDETLSDAISARVQGRIEKLMVKNIGDYINKGQLLYEIYSEDLNTAQQEYIIALQNEKFSTDQNFTSQFSQAAKNKLQLYGMTEAQITQLKTSGQLIQTAPVFALASGFVSEISVTEGSYVDAGTTLFRLSSLNSLWVEAQVYLPYLGYLNEGTEANFSIPGASEKIYSGKVIFLAPQIQAPERFVLARFQINHPSLEIRPGMMANITLQTEKKKSLVLPLDAVIQDSKGVSVWVRSPDGVFEYKMISVGMQNSRQIEVTSGLNEGDVVVVSGAYLLNSEYVFKRGANPMEGMKM